MPSKTLRQVLYIVAMICLAIWLAVSTPLIAFLSSNNPMKEAEPNRYRQKDYITYEFEEISVSNSMTKNLFLSGYLMMNTITEESACSLLFFGNEKNYEIPLSVKVREDIATAMDNIAFTCDTSTIAMQDDLYSVYFYYWANDNSFGMMDTYYQLRKNSTEIDLFVWAGEKTDYLVETTNQNYLFGGIERVYSMNGFVNVQGWGTIPNFPCETQNVYVELVDSAGQYTQYTAKQVMRGDVSYALDNPLYEKSGFFVSFPMEDLLDGDYIVRALIQQGDLVQASVPYSITKTPSEIIWHK